MKYPGGCKDIHVELSNDELIKRLKKLEAAFKNVSQTSNEKYDELAKCLASDVFLYHEHDDVKALVANCLADVFRLHTPDAPFDNPDVLKKVYIFFANELKGLKVIPHSRHYYSLLENLTCVKSFQSCLELDDCQEILETLFENCFKIIFDKQTARNKSLVHELLTTVWTEADHISPKLIETILTRVIEPQKSSNKEAYQLAASLIKKSPEQIEFYIQNYLNNQILMDRSESGGGVIGDKMCLLIYELNVIRPTMLELVLPQIEYKLRSNDLKERREYTKLLSKMFSERDSKLAQTYPQLWDAYLERYSDDNDDIRKTCVQTTSDFLLNHRELHEQIIDQIKSRSLDTDEQLRYDMVQEIIKAVKVDTTLISEEHSEDDLLNILRDRTLDIKIKVRKLALQGLANIYKKIHARQSNRGELFDKIDWIPSKIMRIHFQDSSEDKLVVERLLNSCLVPYNLSSKEKMIELYYVFTKFDEFSVLSLMDIMKERILLHQSMKSIIDSIDDEDKLNGHIMFISRHLLDVNKGQDLMKALIKLLKENVNLKNHFKNLVNPYCSCSKSLELISLILSNLTNSLTPSNLSMAKSLIERMSSIVIDDEALNALFDILDAKVFNVKSSEYDHVVDNGEKGLQLISLILRIHTNRYTLNLNERLIKYFTSRKDQIKSVTLRILSQPTQQASSKHQFSEADLDTLKEFIVNGTQKQAKYAIRTIYSNVKESSGILQEIYKEVKEEMMAKIEANDGDESELTLLVSLGHLAFYIPVLVGLDLKQFISQNVIKDILLPLTSLDKTVSNESHSGGGGGNTTSLSKLAGKWCENEDELPFETRRQIEGVKLLTRWCLGLKAECPSLISTIKLLVRLMNEQNELSEYKDKSEPERARLRLVCGSQILKLAQEPYFKGFIMPDQYHTVSRLIIDPVANVRDCFIKKLQKGLKMFRLSMSYMAMFVLSGLDPHRDRKSRVKKIISGLIKLYREANRKHQQAVQTIADAKQQQSSKSKNLPEYTLAYAISLLAHNCKIDSLKDEVAVKQIKDSLSLILDALLENPDGYQIAFLKKLLNVVKSSDDGLASTLLTNSKDTDQLVAASNLTILNKKVVTISEIAFFLIHSKVVHVVSKEYPFEIPLPNGFFKEKSTNGDDGDIVTLGGTKPNVELETTLATIEDKSPSSSSLNSSKNGVARGGGGGRRNGRKRTTQERQEEAEEEVDEEQEEQPVVQKEAVEPVAVEEQEPEIEEKVENKSRAARRTRGAVATQAKTATKKPTQVESTKEAVVPEASIVQTPKTKARTAKKPKISNKDDEADDDGAVASQPTADTTAASNTSITTTPATRYSLRRK